MTDTEAKALALVNEIEVERYYVGRMQEIRRKAYTLDEALCRAIERHEATEARHAAELREQAERFSEAVAAYGRLWSKRTPSRDEYNTHFAPFILPAPDPLEDVLSEAGYAVFPDDLERVHAALAARGYEVRKIGEAGE